MSDRFVLALGQDAAPAAEAFARERGLPVRVVVETESIDPAQTAILFTLESCVTVDLLDRLFPPDPGLKRVPGLVFAKNGAALCERAWSVARRGREVRRGYYVEIHPYRPFGDIRQGVRRVVGAEATPEALRDALMAPAEVMTISTHSNGYDLLLGGHFALCTVFDQDERDPATTPPCCTSGTCHRLKLPMSDVTGSGRLITADKIDSRILLLLTCLGMVPAHSAVDPGWNYAGALLGNQALAGLVTSWTLFVPDSETIEMLLRAVYSGQSLGRAVAAHNGTPDASRLAVLGDADAATERFSPDDLANVRYVREKSRPAGDGGRFLVAMFFQAAMTEEGDLAELAMTASEKLRAFEHFGLTGFAATDETGIGRGCRDAVIAFLSACGNLIFDYWMPFAESRHLASWPCDQCGGIAERYQFELRHEGLPDRQLRLCPRCGIRADTPADDQRSLTIAEGRARLTGPRPVRNWRAALHLGCHDRHLSTVHPWPAEADGSPAAEMMLPEQRPPGGLIGSIIMLDDNAVSVLSAPIPLGGDPPTRRHPTDS